MWALLEFLCDVGVLLTHWRFFIPFIGALLIAIWLAGHIPSDAAGYAVGTVIVIVGCYVGMKWEDHG